MRTWGLIGVPNCGTKHYSQLFIDNSYGGTKFIACCCCCCGHCFFFCILTFLCHFHYYYCYRLIALNSYYWPGKKAFVQRDPANVKMKFNSWLCLWVDFSGSSKHNKAHHLNAKFSQFSGLYLPFNCVLYSHFFCCWIDSKRKRQK